MASNANNTNASDIKGTDGADLYLRDIQLLVVDQSVHITSQNQFEKTFGKDSQLLDPAIDLSLLRIKFSVKTTITETPNTADIRVYNVSDDTTKKIQSLRNYGQVILQAGYQGNRGVIFRGNIKQVLIGRESATDTFIDIVAGDGAQAYQYAVMTTTLAKGSTLTDQVNAAVKSMGKHGVTAGKIAVLPTQKLPRGKSIYGNTKEFLRQVANTSDSSWSIQEEQLTIVDNKTYLPGEAVVLTSKTGMIGTPQQTNVGVNVKCLLNPRIRAGGRVVIDNRSVAKLKLNLEQIALAKGNASQILELLPRDLQADGTYMALVLEHQGDTRGVEWYTSITGLNVDVSANPSNSVQTGEFP